MTPAHRSSESPSTPGSMDHALRRRKIDDALRLRSLWTAYRLAMLFHVQLAFMPLFHGLSVAIGNTVNPAQVPWVYRAMLGYFLQPLGALLLISLIADSVVPDSRADQVFLRALLFLIGLLINRQAWFRWHPGLAAMQT